MISCQLFSIRLGGEGVGGTIISARKWAPDILMAQLFAVLLRFYRKEVDLLPWAQLFRRKRVGLVGMGEGHSYNVGRG